MDYNKGIYDLSFMSVTQTVTFLLPNTDNLQEFAENTAVSKAGHWHHQECVEGISNTEQRLCVVAGSSFKSHHRSKFFMMLHNTRGVFRCRVKLVFSFTWRWRFVLMGPNIAHRGDFYHVLWHHGGSHVALCSFVDLLSRLAVWSSNSFRACANCQFFSRWS